MLRKSPIVAMVAQLLFVQWLANMLASADVDCGVFRV